MGIARDLAGKIFGRLTVVSIAKESPSGRSRWLCECSCGGEKIVRTSELTAGKSKSCGCLLRETGFKLGKRSFPKHGMYRSPEYRAWQNMKSRCSNPKATRYERYGGRGISICDRWNNSFDNFLADMGLRPSPAHSIDRKETDGNYEKSNCRWATGTVQQHNRDKSRFSRFLEVDGKLLRLTEAARLYGVSQSTLHGRLARGLSVEAALQLRGDHHDKAI